ncbi:MAG: hypothetical protein QM490_02775 [Candidatus Gracilibacteria bacterium]
MITKHSFVDGLSDSPLEIREIDGKRYEVIGADVLRTMDETETYILAIIDSEPEIIEGIKDVEEITWIDTKKGIITKIHRNTEI